VDIAWDLAGVILEWELGADATDHFLSCYERASGDRSRARLQDYMLAYSAFQAGFAKMAASALRESEMEESKRLLRDHERYRSLLLEFENERDTQAVTVMSRTPQSLTPPSPVLLT
jgi:aminoglycoside phosphotransferase family enzyme